MSDTTMTTLIELMDWMREHGAETVTFSGDWIEDEDRETDDAPAIFAVKVAITGAGGTQPTVETYPSKDVVTLVDEATADYETEMDPMTEVSRWYWSQQFGE